MIEILVPGAYTTIQDLGRPGHEIHGMPGSGAFDPFLASVANRIAGNAPEAPLLEFALTGPSLRFHHDAVVALASFHARYLLNGSAAPEFQPFHAPAGSSLEFQTMQGWFGYLSFAGGISAEMVL
ncbi:MAG TPA: hypothetical protein VLR94_06810, partial [Acidobacteriota bacterium]|nr:hypothetical protein [Acidobacteriota bacterium]